MTSLWEVDENILNKGVQGKQIWKAIAEVLRLRAANAVSRDPSVRRSGQDDESVGG